MSVKVDQVVRAFEKLGMEINEGRDKWAYFKINGRSITKTRVPHGRGDLSGNLPDMVRTQLKLNDELSLKTN